MKRKTTKILKTLVLALLLSATGSLSTASAVQTGVIEGENDVTNMIVSVIVPVNLNFTLDPLELESEGGNQIAPADYVFINKTGAPVEVAFDITVKLNNGTGLVDDQTLIAKDDNTVKDKNLFFAILGADSLTSDSLDFFNADDQNVRGYYDSKKDTLIPFDATDNKATINFALAPATESMPGEGFDTLAEDNRGVGVFQFYAELNTYAQWSGGDISVSGAYTLTPLRRSTYDIYIETNAFTDGGWGTQLKSPLS